MANKALKNLLLQIPFVKTKIKRFDELNLMIYNSGFDPGHYYSSVPDLKEIEENASAIFGDKKLEEVNLNTDNQLALLEKLKTYYPQYPYFDNAVDTAKLRYIKSDKAFYRYSDAVFLYCIIRHFQPTKIIEVGSGHSSAIMLDTNEFYLENKMHVTFIEPYPEERLMKILREQDKKQHTVIKQKVQSVSLDVFKKLEQNDILFIDSSHVSKTGSDLNYLMFEVLPALKPGVLIHFHDIFYPFELPKKWIVENRWFWNENYLLHAFLMNNNKYEIINFNTYLQKIKTDWFKTEMPECLLGEEPTGSIWIRKL
jgi:hypothetical protein